MSDKTRSAVFFRFPHAFPPNTPPSRRAAGFFPCADCKMFCNRRAAPSTDGRSPQKRLRTAAVFLPCRSARAQAHPARGRFASIKAGGAERYSFRPARSFTLSIFTSYASSGSTARYLRSRADTRRALPPFPHPGTHRKNAPAYPAVPPPLPSSWESAQTSLS